MEEQKQVKAEELEERELTDEELEKVTGARVRESQEQLQENIELNY